jgi:UDP-N-acetyl-D-glucosamine dehydrogenase
MPPTSSLKTLSPIAVPTPPSPGLIEQIKAKRPRVHSAQRSVYQQLKHKIIDREAKIAILGLGYVGLPLALAFAAQNFRVLGVDIAQDKLSALQHGQTDIRDVAPQQILQALASHQLSLSHDPAELAACEVVIICVPTPMTPHKTPDLRCLEQARDMIKTALRPGQLIILESTTYPGTCQELFAPLAAAKGLTFGENCFLGYSPERVDPGNTTYNTQTTPKVVSGYSVSCLDLVNTLYQQMGTQTVTVRDTTSAELVKVFENTFRAVNIGLVNELAILCHQMGINVWEVLDAAGSKPFGFMKFTPGPGIGGHCIPVDPVYLSYKAKELGGLTRFSDLAMEINGQMPRYVQSRLNNLLGQHGKPLYGSRILILGVAYKPNVSDWRESPAIAFIEHLKQAGAIISYSDPYVPTVHDRSGTQYQSVPLTQAVLQACDAVVIMTDHTCVNYQQVVESAPLVLDTRNVTRPWQDTHPTIDVL